MLQCHNNEIRIISVSEGFMLLTEVRVVLKQLLRQFELLLTCLPLLNDFIDTNVIIISAVLSPQQLKSGYYLSWLFKVGLDVFDDPNYGLFYIFICNLFFWWSFIWRNGSGATSYVGNSFRDFLANKKLALFAGSSKAVGLEKLFCLNH